MAEPIAQQGARIVVALRLPLRINIPIFLGSNIENTIRRLNTPSRLKLTQQIARRKRHHALRQPAHKTPLTHIGVLIKQHRLHIGIVRDSRIQHLQRRLFAPAA